MNILRLAVLTAAWLVLADIVGAGERMQCSAEPAGENWHYWTKMPGYAGDVRADRCWYDGPPMKPRNEFYWSEQALPMVPIIVPQTRFDDFWSDTLKEIEDATR